MQTSSQPDSQTQLGIWSGAQKKNGKASSDARLFQNLGSSLSNTPAKCPGPLLDTQYLTPKQIREEYGHLLTPVRLKRLIQENPVRTMTMWVDGRTTEVYSSEDIGQAFESMKQKEMPEFVPLHAIRTLGMDRKTLSRLVANGEVRTEKAGNFTKYSRTDVERALEQNPALVQLSRDQIPTEVPQGWLNSTEIKDIYGLFTDELKRLVAAKKVRLDKFMYWREETHAYAYGVFYDAENIEELLRTRDRAGEIEAAKKIGLKRTSLNHRKGFEQTFPLLLELLGEAFGKEWDRDVAILRLVMESKQKEREALEPSRLTKRQHWEVIFSEIQDLLEKKERNLQAALELELTKPNGFYEFKRTHLAFFLLEKELLEADGRPVWVRVSGGRPWSAAYLRDGEEVALLGLRLDAKTSRFAQRLEKFLREFSRLSVCDFRDDLTYRLQGPADSKRVQEATSVPSWMVNKLKYLEGQ
jgi:hypothetical protein